MKYSDSNVKNDYHDESKEKINNHKTDHSKDSSYHEDNNIIISIITDQIVIEENIY